MLLGGSWPCRSTASPAHAWGLGSWWSWLKTMTVLWLFILSLLWVSHFRTKERDTSSHSRALSWFLSPSLDTQHNMPMDRHAGIEHSFMGVQLDENVCLSLALRSSYPIFSCAHTQTHIGFSECCSAGIMQHLHSPECSIWTSAHHMNTIVFISWKRLRISQIHKCTGMTIT